MELGRAVRRRSSGGAPAASANGQGSGPAPPSAAIAIAAAAAHALHLRSPAGILSWLLVKDPLTLSLLQVAHRMVGRVW